MNKTARLLLFCLILLLLLAACTNTETAPTVGIISAVDSATMPTGPAKVAKEQQIGYEASGQANNASLRLAHKPESLLTDEVQVTVRNMVEDQRYPVVALVGATTNSGTTRMAALANFFNVPMVVPSAIGDNLLPSSNLWTFRLSAPGSAHAAYLFDEILTRQVISELTTGDEFFTPLSLGILYEQNTFGESTAVETAKAAMSQEVQIGYYGHFNPDAPDPSRLLQSLAAMQESRVHLVYIVASNPDAAQTITRAFNDFFIPAEAPLLLGQSGGFTSRQFLESPEASNIVILRQQIIPDRCPDEIETLAEAQAYAALHLLNFAIEQSYDQLDPAENPDPAKRREAIRDSLKASSLNLPCLGPTSFENSGQNRNLQFELLHAVSGAPRTINPERLLQLLAPKVNFDPFQ